MTLGRVVTTGQAALVARHRVLMRLEAAISPKAQGAQLGIPVHEACHLAHLLLPADW